MRKIEVIDQTEQLPRVTGYLWEKLNHFDKNPNLVAQVIAALNGRTVLGPFKGRYQIAPYSDDQKVLWAVDKGLFHDSLAEEFGIDIGRMVLPVTQHTPSFWGNVKDTVSGVSVRGTDVNQISLDGTDKEITLRFEQFTENKGLTKVVWGMEDSVQAAEIQSRRLPRREEMARWHDLQV